MLTRGRRDSAGGEVPPARLRTRPCSRKGDLRRGRIDALRFGRWATLDQQLSEPHCRSPRRSTVWPMAGDSQSAASSPQPRAGGRHGSRGSAIRLV